MHSYCKYSSYSNTTCDIYFQPRRFFLDPLNIIDVLAVVPFYIELIIVQAYGKSLLCISQYMNHILCRMSAVSIRQFELLANIQTRLDCGVNRCVTIYLKIIYSASDVQSIEVDSSSPTVSTLTNHTQIKGRYLTIHILHSVYRLLTRLDLD